MVVEVCVCVTMAGTDISTVMLYGQFEENSFESELFVDLLVT